jgi:hypothetical protein
VLTHPQGEYDQSLPILSQMLEESYYGTSEMKVMVGGIRKGLYDRYDVKKLLSDNRLLDEQIVEDVLLVIND